ncbi:MAG: permease [Desulfobacterales bacterium]|nr:permease [Desulfobacterales bacterium]
MPAAVSLHQQGANKGAVTSFLISTPESGADSIAITYALLDPIMTVVRPLAAFLTAFTAGIAVNHMASDATSASTAATSASPLEHSPKRPGPAFKTACAATGRRAVRELRFAFTDFWADMAPAFFVGVLLAGMISALIPAQLLTAYLGGGIAAMLIMLAAGIPLYICASASTPIAAALILKGVSPGAALVFLLAGPATNAAALAVVLRTLGRRTTLIYLGSIAGCALLCGVLVDVLYTALGLDAVAAAGQAGEAIPAGMAQAAAVGLLVTTAFGLGRKYVHKAETEGGSSEGRAAGLSIRPHPRAVGRPPQGPT